MTEDCNNLMELRLSSAVPEQDQLQLEQWLIFWELLTLSLSLSSGFAGSIDCTDYIQLLKLHYHLKQWLHYL